MSNPAFGKTIKEADIIALALTGPGQTLVQSLMLQMVKADPFRAIFGPVTGANETQRWADYSRYDWSIRQLPAINVYESGTEDKTSGNGWLNGVITIQVFWPASLRRSDLRQVPVAFKAALQNFLESDLAVSLLDPLYSIESPNKVPGLNELGKVVTWTPNVEGLVEEELVPVTMVDVRYRLDLRAWYRAMNADNRTKALPFARTLADLEVIGGEYDGVPATDAEDVQIILPQTITVTP